MAIIRDNPLAELLELQAAPASQPEASPPVSSAPVRDLVPAPPLLADADDAAARPPVRGAP